MLVNVVAKLGDLLVCMKEVSETGSNGGGPLTSDNCMSSLERVDGCPPAELESYSDIAFPLAVTYLLIFPCKLAEQKLSCPGKQA